jgi:hypothetical protein
VAAEANIIGDLEVGSPAAAKSSDAVKRMVSVGLESSLERFDDPGLLSQGKVNIIALDAVVERFGKRWALRRDQVYDHVDRTLQRYLGLQGYYLRVSETDFLICQPELSRFSGQAACLRYLREILGHFLGEAHWADQGVHQVTGISTSAVNAERVDARYVEAEEKAEEAIAAPAPIAVAEAEEHPAPAPAPVARQGGLATVDRWTPFVASDGREVRVTCTLEPVFELKAYRRIGFRMVRRVILVATDEELSPAALATLSRADILRIDLATIARGLHRLYAEAPEEQLPSLIVPVSFTSLSNRTGRADIVDAFTEASSLVKQGIICEISDVEGVPQGALLSICSLIRPFAFLVVGRLDTTPPAPAIISQMKGSGLQALSCECPPNLGEAEFLGWAKATIEASKRIAKSVLVYRLASARNAGLAALMGATHASVRLQGHAAAPDATRQGPALVGPPPS